MKFETLSVAALASFAGLACTASAQNLQPFAQKVQINPISIKINGVEHPLDLSASAADGTTVAYDSLTSTTVAATGPAGIIAGLDDVAFDGSLTGPQDLTGIRVSFGTADVVTNPTRNVVVRATWYTGVNPGTDPTVPVGTGEQLTFDITFAPPAGGWAANTLYEQTHFTGFTQQRLAAALGAVEYNLLVPTTLVPNTDFEIPLVGGGTQIGTTNATTWIDTNNDFVVQQAEGANYTVDPGTGPVPVGLAVSLQVNTPSNPGACCLPSGGGCQQLSAAQCTTFGGIHTPGASCGSCNFGPGILFNNGPMDTGATTSNGTAAPAGFSWSECPIEFGVATMNTAGVGGSGAANLRLADDFTVPAGQAWTPTSFRIYGYQTGGTNAAIFSTATLRILSGRPDANPTVIFGDTTTNRVPVPTFTNLYRIFNATPGTTRRIVQMDIPVSGVTLQPGEYWFDFNITTTTGGNFTPLVTLYDFNSNTAVVNLPRANAMQRQTITGLGDIWIVPIISVPPAGATAPAPAVAGELPFIISGTSAPVGGTCYPNCDNSTEPPILNVGDFSCFLSQFANGNSYANCDNSTEPPVLNVGDFSCFLAAFANGCP